MREGGANCLKYLKMGWNRKEGRGHKDFKKGGRLGQGVNALKRAGELKPTTNYVIHALNILLEFTERNTSFKIEEQFNDLMIDRSYVKTEKHLFSKG